MSPLTPKRCAVLGSGPAGLMAAQAADLKGWAVEILTAKVQPSFISGAQYLDRAIPGITGTAPDSEVTFYKKGFVMDYAMKIYGDPLAPTSWDRYEHNTQYPLWYMVTAYDTLWDKFKSRMHGCVVDANVMQGLLDTAYDMIISTIPLKGICMRPHLHIFTEQVVTITPELPKTLGKKHDWLLETPGEFNWIMYNGKKKQEWYRACSIAGEAYTEYPGNLDMPNSVHIKKPIATNCNCWGGPRLLLAGRYGKWDKGQLASHAYEAMLDVV